MKQCIASMLLLALLHAPATADKHHYICGSAAEIEAAAAAINGSGQGGAIGILPGEYNLKSDYRKQLEDDPATAVPPVGRDHTRRRYPLYISSPNVTVYATVPGAVKLVGEADAVLNDSLPRTSQFRVFRGGMFFLDTKADNVTLRGLDIDGSVPMSETFNHNSYCHRHTNDGKGCWDWSHKAIVSHSPSARIIDCRIHNWAGEMVYAGRNKFKRLEIRDCKIYDNQVSALSGTWQLKCHHNEFYNLTGQVMEGLHSFSCQYYDNYFHDCDGGGLNILGPVTSLAPPQGWWIDIRRNVFERMNSRQFGCIYLSKQTTPDVSPPRNVAIVDNTFRDCRTVLSVSLGPAEQVHFESNLVVLDAASHCDGIATKSGSLRHALIRGNTWMLTQHAVDSGGALAASAMDTGDHAGTRWIDNYYKDCGIAFDLTPPSTQMFFSGERYESPSSVNMPQKTNAADYADAIIPSGNSNDAPISTGAFRLQFAVRPLFLRMAVKDEDGKPVYAHGTELRLQGCNRLPTHRTAFLIDGRGCQLRDGWPVLLSDGSDYVLLRYDANLKLWVEVTRETPRANQLFKLAHRGAAADLPLFDKIKPLIVDDVNVIDAAFYGWEFYETDTGLKKIYTASGWQTIWALAGGEQTREAEGAE